jgi:hypothetical protein
LNISPIGKLRVDVEISRMAKDASRHADIMLAIRYQGRESCWRRWTMSYEASVVRHAAILCVPHAYNIWFTFYSIIQFTAFLAY